MCNSHGDIVSIKMVDCYENEGYMREEDGRVYTLFVPHDASDEDYFVGELYVSDSENTMDQSECREYMLYDFTLNEDDTYTSMSFLKKTAGLETFKVLNVSSIEIGGENMKVMKVGWVPQYLSYDGDCIADYSVIEGVGAVEYGCLNYYEFSDHFTTIWYWNCFHRLFDMEGNLLYGCDSTDDWIDWGSFVSEVDALKSTEVSDTQVYDMMGRHIAAPAPGQLYIQNGRKHIAR